MDKLAIFEGRRWSRIALPQQIQAQATPVRGAEIPGNADESTGDLLTDGGEDVRDLPLYLNPRAEHLIDWFHITMRLTVMTQMTKGLRSREYPELAAEILEELVRLKWFLWHGNVFRALQVVDDLQIDLDNTEQPSIEQQKLLKMVTEFGGYIRANGAWTPTMASATEVAKRSPAPSSSRPSIRWSASAWSRSSRCAG